VHVDRDFVENVKETIEEDKIRYRLYARDQRLIPETSLIRSVLIVHVPRSKITARSLQRDNINRRIQFAHLVHYSRMRREPGEPCEGDHERFTVILANYSRPELRSRLQLLASLTVVYTIR